jgi:hypothetical protein
MIMSMCFAGSRLSVGGWAENTIRKKDSTDKTGGKNPDRKVQIVEYRSAPYSLLLGLPKATRTLSFRPPRPPGRDVVLKTDWNGCSLKSDVPSGGVWHTTAEHTAHPGNAGARAARPPTTTNADATKDRQAHRCRKTCCHKGCQSMEIYMRNG